ncbi:ABC transporter ATP-binding protein [Brucella sp. NBRC 113783]|uniref:ABC transporter ATP-binding protein n=1 Tax=Brucella sp. NBRC 113783 TaxID=3075478 RepID=UPI0029C0AE3F|nr:ABC transporter ATP-binding protein [Brucella sp. NBRC 113783]MDX4075583.1 ABC transporter ATP-binding protein [Brucella sp. NBRC 113783]
MTNPTPIIEITNGKKVFGKFTALDDINISIAKGEIVTLLGPSGCGKTTLMRIIAGFESLTSGSLKIDAKDVATLAPEKRPVNMVFQRYALFPHLDVFENVAYGLKVKAIGKDERRERVQRMLKIVQMEHLQHRYITELSGGQCQRVALARALVNEPKVLLLDEPLAALDLKIRQHMLTEMKRIHAETGATFIYVTHDQDEAMILSDRVVLIDRGRIVQIDTPQRMYNNPNCLFSAKFLGETNILHGTIVEDNAGRSAFKAADGNFSFRSETALARNSSAIMSVRPEAISLCSDKPANDNAIAATVTDMLFTGSRSFYSLLSDNGEIIRAQIQNAPGISRPAVGDRVHVAWPHDGAVVLPAPPQNEARAAK